MIDNNIITKKAKMAVIASILTFFLWLPPVKAHASVTVCQNNDCTTSVHQHESSWFMMISCEDGGFWAGGGSGQWNGSC